ncbi:hypothetical protein T492DRAFT_112558 [Pavlovales sp. CCMP2436]|nr:hypothetical protein T492DRAFT_112558 [Pavlovales sp. CCMP2436]
MCSVSCTLQGIIDPSVARALALRVAAVQRALNTPGLSEQQPHSAADAEDSDALEADARLLALRAAQCWLHEAAGLPPGATPLRLPAGFALAPALDLLASLSDAEASSWLAEPNALDAAQSVHLLGALRPLRAAYAAHSAPARIVSWPPLATGSGEGVEASGMQTKFVVCGGTGAGKSTLLNALLGVAELLPTSCMRACTATIIE